MQCIISRSQSYILLKLRLRQLQRRLLFFLRALKPMKNYQSALITGGSSGIGLALASQLVASGTDVWILGRSREKLSAALAELDKKQTRPDQRICSLAADVSNREEITELLEQFAQAEGAPDLLINCAGVAHPGEFEKLDLDVFESMMRINYFGTVYVTRALVNAMISRGSGHIVNVSSVAGFVGVYGYTAYGASKYAVRGFSDVLRAELKPKGIQVSVIFPPDTDTPQLAYENQFKPAVTKALASTSQILSADKVAEISLKGIRANRYIIIPGFEGQWMFWLTNLLGSLTYPVMDLMVRSALRQPNGAKHS